MRTFKVFLAIALKKLTNENHYQFMLFILKLLTDDGQSHEDGDGHYYHVTMGVTAQFNKFQTAVTKLGVVLEKMVKSSRTRRVVRRDTWRDEIFMGFGGIVRFMAKYHFELPMRELARDIQDVFDHYGRLTNQGYTTETASITNLIEELLRRYAAALAQLGLTGWLNALKAANEEFVEEIVERFAESGDKIDLDTREVRDEVDNALYAILDFVEAKITVTGDRTPFEGFIRDFNTQADYYNKQLAIHLGRLAAKKNKNPQPPEEGEAEESQDS